jgi:hypothetical protein
MRMGHADEKDGEYWCGRRDAMVPRQVEVEAAGKLAGRWVVRNGMVPGVVPGRDKVAARVGEMDLRGGRFACTMASTFTFALLSPCAVQIAAWGRSNGYLWVRSYHQW